MKALADFLPHAIWALAVAAHVYLALEHALTKGTPMSDLPEAAVVQAQAESAPIATAIAEASAPDHSVAVAQSVIQSVSAHPDIQPHHRAAIIVAILDGLAQAAPAVFQVTRASGRTQAGVGLGLGLAEIIASAFLHPAE